MSYAHGRSKLPITITSPTATAGANFGKALALDGSMAVIAPPELAHDFGRGAACTFERSSLLPFP